MAFPDSEERDMVKPCSLVICGPGEGQTDQYACAFKDAIHMLLSAWKPMGITETTKLSNTSLRTDDQMCNIPILESGCVIPAGGTFEILLSRALLQHGRIRSVSGDMNTCIPSVSQLLADALLSVPRHIYSHSPRCFLQTQARLHSYIQTHSHPFSLVYKQENSPCPLEEGKKSIHCCGEADMSVQVFMSSLGLESVSCKYQLCLAVLQCVSSLLRVDTLLRTHTALHTQSHRLATISWEETEDEAQD